MRPVLAIVSLSLFATPAAAQSAAGAPLPPPHAMQLPPRVADPATAARLVDSMQALSRALLEIRIGGVQAVLEGRSATPAERNLTVGDLARRDNPGVERDLQQKIAEARPMIEQGIRAMNDSLPAIQQGLVDAQRSLERAIANMPDPNYPKR